MAYRVLILGSRGMLGHMVEHVLAADARCTVRGVGRAEFDVEGDPNALDALLRDADYVINCIGLTVRHIDESNPLSVARAIHVNAQFPHTLAAAAVHHGVRVIHMSTDGVFSGQSSVPYTEDMTPDALDVYGRTKILGESKVPNVLNIRCSIIGPNPMKREGLWEWIAQQSDGATIDGYTNHIWHGVTTLQFAQLCDAIISGGHFDTLVQQSRIHHFVPNETVTKYEILTTFRDVFGKRVDVREVRGSDVVDRTLATKYDALTRLVPPSTIRSALAEIHALQTSAKVA